LRRVGDGGMIFVYMKKFLNLLIVNRPELAGRWWHRMANVLIYGSTIVVLILGITVICLSCSSWTILRYTSYSFEPNYSSASGKEVSCYFYPSFDFSGTESSLSTGNPIIDCGDISSSQELLEKIPVSEDPKPEILPLSYFTQMYGNKIASTTGLDEEFHGSYVQAILAQALRNTDGSIVTPNEFVNQQINYGTSHSDWINNIKVKERTFTLWNILVADIFHVLITTLIWFIFWESIIYRALIYIIYGKRK